MIIPNEQLEKEYSDGCEYYGKNLDIDRLNFNIDNYDKCSIYELYLTVKHVIINNITLNDKFILNLIHKMNDSPLFLYKNLVIKDIMNNLNISQILKDKIKLIDLLS